MSGVAVENPFLICGRTDHAFFHVARNAYVCKMLA